MDWLAFGILVMLFLVVMLAIVMAIIRFCLKVLFLILSGVVGCINKGVEGIEQNLGRRRELKVRQSDTRMAAIEGCVERTH